MTQAPIQDTIHVVLASDANYRPGLEVTKASMIAACSDPSRLAFHIYDETALANLPELDAFERYHTSLMPYLRLFLPELLPHVNWIVYSDVDTVWCRDVCELWEFARKEENSHAKGAKETPIFWVKDFELAVAKVRPWLVRARAMDFNEDRYACSGVCLMNLRKMREDHLRSRAIDIVRQCGTPPFADQDILNLFYNHDSVLLPEHWDVVGHWRNERGWNHNIGADGQAVYHLFGIGRHFHDSQPVDYPSPYDFWNRAAGRRHWHAPLRRRYRLMAACWWASGLVRFLPGKMLRCRVYRQWLFARVIWVKQRA